MQLNHDPARGREAARLLWHAFNTTGILGHTAMPEDILPTGMERGSLDHLLFITLTDSIDYQRDADALWRASRETFEDVETKYLLHPESLHLAPQQKVVVDMQKHGLSKKPVKDAGIWRTVGVTFHNKWGGDPRNFLQDCGWDSLVVLRRLGEDRHLHGGSQVKDYPYLRGKKIGPVWLRMLRDNVGITCLQGLERVPIPVDVHVARASLALGIVRGEFREGLNPLFEQIREAWFRSVEGLTVKGRPMIALDMDEPLWHLSRGGCTRRNKDTGSCLMRAQCEAGHLCVPGTIWVTKNHVELDT